MDVGLEGGSNAQDCDSYLESRKGRRQVVQTRRAVIRDIGRFGQICTGENDRACLVGRKVGLRADRHRNMAMYAGSGMTPLR